MSNLVPSADCLCRCLRDPRILRVHNPEQQIGTASLTALAVATPDMVVGEVGLCICTRKYTESRKAQGNNISLVPSVDTSASVGNYVVET